MYTYPVTLTSLENGHYMVEFPHVPQALTYGENEASALQWAKDALHEALDQYMQMGLPLPLPCHSTSAHHVSVDPTAGIKLYLYQVMLEKGIDQEKLAALLQCEVAHVNSLLDIFQVSTLEEISRALAVLGLNLKMTIQPAA